MKIFFGAVGLLFVLAFVGTLVVKELQQATKAAGGPGAVISAPVAEAESQQPMKQPNPHSVEGTVQQPHPFVNGE